MEAKKKTRFRLIDFKWLFLVDMMVIIGGVMAFGFVLFVLGYLQEENSILMLSMILPMSVVAVAVTWTVLHFVRKRMDRLFNAITEVADGNLDVQIDTDHAGEYREMYETFNHMTCELKSTKQEMQNFINDFSHEFKTPITSISGFSKYLIETGTDCESPERMEYLQIIADESTRLSSLAQKTLLLTKMEACQIIPDQKNYSLTEQIRHCVITLMPEMDAKQIEVALDGADCNYYGNPEFMEQIWINLLNNAIKFTPEKGTITIHIQQSEAGISVSVQDTGIGMDKETAERVFEKYFQADTEHAVRGSGIGLSIVQRIVNLCGGTIRVESTLGVGSTFTVILPNNH